MTLREAYGYGSSYLESQDILEADLDAWYLLEHVTKRSRSDYYAHGEEQLAPVQIISYKKLLEKRGGRIPLQYITEQQEFMGLSFHVNGEVLIPRQDTETLVEEVLKDLRPGMRVLDLCTGSGCILISLLTMCPGALGMGTDISPTALAVARENAKRLGVQADFRKSDMFARISGEPFDCIVSNPPYIASGEIESLMTEVREYEPREALDGGADGLDFYRILAQEAGSFLKEQGGLYVEIGCDQGRQVSALLREAGFSQVAVIQDLCGKDRVVRGTWERQAGRRDFG
ncbi:MAG: peptide chain release factor N(5)-glutamine methyltransferase [Lachnospiraceae bacterium]|nr:peptide chain release factor N(5)-glutamine methyltransferase [Lachnospiraceae bacterium]